MVVAQNSHGTKVSKIKDGVLGWYIHSPIMRLRWDSGQYCRNLSTLGDTHMQSPLPAAFELALISYLHSHSCVCQFQSRNYTVAAGIEGYLSVVLDKASSVDLTFSVTTTDGTAECELTALLLKKGASLLQVISAKNQQRCTSRDSRAFTATLVPPEGRCRLLVVVDTAFIEIVDGTGGLIQDLSDC